MTARRLVHFVSWTAALALGFRHWWHERFHVIGDGVSYLDIGDAFARGDWQTAINAYWSPLYAWILGLAIRVASPSPDREFAVLGAVNIAAFVIALAAFTCLLTALAPERNAGDHAADPQAAFPDWAWLALGYAIFIWASFHLLAIANVTPDMLIAAAVYFCTALIVRLRGGDTRWLVACGLGAGLGVGYLMKAPMFPLTPVFLGCAAVAIGNLRTAATRVGVAALLFALIAGPFVLAISLEKRRFTFGESGRINVAWTVNRVPQFFWQGGPPRSGMPTHPPRKIHEDPDVFEFARPIRVTYPIWHDPSYWYDGVTPYFDLAGLNWPLRESRALYSRLVEQQTIFIAAVILLYALAGSLRRWVANIRSAWPVWVPAGAGLAMFTVAGAEGRYVGPFVVLAMLAALASGRLPARRRASAILIALAVTILLVESVLITRRAIRPHPVLETTNINAEVARRLGDFGIGRGDYVAIMRPGRGVYWARLAGVQIVAEVPLDSSARFWRADESERRDILVSLAATGARVLLTAAIPPGGAGPDGGGWIPLGETGWFAYPLRP